MRSLVIDDEVVALNKLVALLGPLGQCDTAANGQQALEQLRNAYKQGCPYRLITIDINMPDMDGITLLGRLQREERLLSCVPARKMMVTAASTESHVLAAASGSCDAFLAKPVRRAVLMERLAGLGLISVTVAHAAGQEEEGNKKAEVKSQK